MFISQNIKIPNFWKLINSSVVFLYFILLVLHNLSNNTVVNYSWYLILIGSFLLGIIQPYFRISLDTFLFAGIFLVSATLNIFFVGNSAVTDIIYTVLYFGVFNLFADDELDERFLFAAIYVDCAILSFFLIKVGFGKAIFTSLSNNFVSVLLLLPAVVLYIRREHFQKPISILPAITIVITCLLATGRGGILVSLILLLSILFYHLFLRKDWRNTRKFAIYILGIFTIAALIVFCLPFLLSSISKTGIFQRFIKYGMYGTGRTGIWSEYFTNMFQNIKNLFLGVRFSDLSLMIRYKNNLHNSILNIHALYGLVFTLYVCFLLIRIIIMCVKKKNWIYLSVMLVFLVRSMTDRFFGGGQAGTPILLFLLFYISKPIPTLPEKPILGGSANAQLK